MKILGIVTSPRKQKTSYYAMQETIKAVKKDYPSIAAEIIELAGLDIKPCTACGTCKNELTCSIKDDFFKLITKLADQDIKGMIISTPVYMGSITALGKAFLDRTLSFRRNGFLFRNRVGAVLAIGGARNGGQELTIQSIHAAFLIHDMILAGDGKPGSHFGGSLWGKGKIEEIEKDDKGLETAVNTGKRVAELITKIHA